jgi:hypothetical protein
MRARVAASPDGNVPPSTCRAKRAVGGQHLVRVELAREEALERGGPLPEHLRGVRLHLRAHVSPRPRALAAERAGPRAERLRQPGAQKSLSERGAADVPRRDEQDAEQRRRHVPTVFFMGRLFSLGRFSLGGDFHVADH